MDRIIQPFWYEDAMLPQRLVANPLDSTASDSSSDSDETEHIQP